MPVDGEKKFNAISGRPEIFSGVLDAWITDNSTDIDVTGRVSITGDYDVRTFTGNETFLLIENTFGAPHTITYGTILAPQTIVLQDGENVVLNFNGVSGWETVGDTTTVVTNATGMFRLSRHDGVENITATIITGHDLTQATGMTLRVLVRDTAADRAWQPLNLDVDAILNIEATSTNDGYAAVWDNDFINVNVVDAATGEITFTENGRDFEYVWSELWVAAPTTNGLLPLDNVASFVTTSTFQSFGDANALFTGADGDRIHVEYGDNRRDNFVFIDGVAREERKSLAANELEFQVTAGGQVEIRHINGASTVAAGWYEVKDGVVRTQSLKNFVSTDCSVEIVSQTDTEVDVSVNPIGVNEFINNIEPYHIVMAHEGAGGNGKTVRVNGVNCTYQNLQNATDNGNGSVSFGGGTNGNFNRRASTVETITKVGEYFDVITGATGQFDTQRIQISTDSTIQANVTGQGNILINLAGGGVTVFDESGVNVYTNGTENGTYRFKRTYFGFSIERNGVEVYTSPEVVNDYSSDEPPKDTIPDFDNTLKIGQAFLDDVPFDRPFTILEETSGVAVAVSSAYDQASFPFVVIEYVRDSAETSGAYLRANGGGRQSQVRFTKNTGQTEVASSGANTSDPIVLQTVVTSKTIKHVVQFTDPVVHSDIEIAPAGTALDANLTITPSATGQLKVLSFQLFETNPLPKTITQQGVLDATQITTDATAGTVYNVLPTNGECAIFDGTYVQTGTIRKYFFRFDIRDQDTVFFNLSNIVPLGGAVGGGQIIGLDPSPTSSEEPYADTSIYIQSTFSFAVNATGSGTRSTPLSYHMEVTIDGYPEAVSSDLVNLIDDQSSSGYIDIGDMRFQTGRATTSGGIVAITLPAPMLDTSYSITITAANGNNVAMMYTADNTTSFQAVARDPAGGAVDTSFSWQVVGLKP